MSDVEGWLYKQCYNIPQSLVTFELLLWVRNGWKLLIRRSYGSDSRNGAKKISDLVGERYKQTNQICTWLISNGGGPGWIRCFHSCSYPGNSVQKTGVHPKSVLSPLQDTRDTDSYTHSHLESSNQQQHVFGRRKETGEPEGNPHGHREYKLVTLSWLPKSKV